MTAPKYESLPQRALRLGKRRLYTHHPCDYSVGLEWREGCLLPLSIKCEDMHTKFYPEVAMFGVYFCDKHLLAWVEEKSK